MKVETLEYNTMKFQKMSVLRFLVCLKMILTQLSGVNEQM